MWLEGRNLQIDQPSVKLAPKRHGPFKIRKVLSPITYQLELPPQWKIHDVFHVDLLTPYHETELHGPNFTKPPPDLIDGEEEYEVKEILQSQKFGRQCKVQSLIKWKGYPDSENQWVNWNDLHADEALADFKKKNPNALSHIKAGVDKAKDNNHCLPMSNNDHSSPPLIAILGVNLPPEVQQLFLDWQPTVPSSWTTCYVQTSFYYAATSDCIVSYFSLPNTEAHVRYNLAAFPCTIQSPNFCLYDTI